VKSKARIGLVSYESEMRRRVPGGRKRRKRWDEKKTHGDSTPSEETPSY